MTGPGSLGGAGTVLPPAEVVRVGRAFVELAAEAEEEPERRWRAKAGWDDSAENGAATVATPGEVAAAARTPRLKPGFR